jgi:hypothetical protein
MKTQKPIFTPENPPRYGDLFDLLSEAFPIVEETPPDYYKPGHLADLTKRIRAALETATV